VTTIELLVSEGNGGTTHLTIHNLRGKLKRRLINKELEPGKYTLSWDGKDDRGHDVPSGVYLYMLRCGDKVFTKKLTIIR